MAEEHYSNRELDRIFKGFEDTMKSGFDSLSEKIIDGNKTAERIEAQTIKTNGRVTTLESWRENLRGAWRLVMWVGIPLFGVFVGFMSWLTVQVVQFPDKIQSSIAEEFDNYEVQ